MSKINKYIPRLCKVQPWEQLEGEFDRWFGEQHRHNIADLIRFIRTRYYPHKLFGLRSMNKLVIGIYDPIEWDRETLHITFDVNHQEWHFVYYALPSNPPEFVRTYSVEDGIKKFENFIKMIGW